MWENQEGELYRCYWYNRVQILLFSPHHVNMNTTQQWKIGNIGALKTIAQIWSFSRSSILNWRTLERPQEQHLFLTFPYLSFSPKTGHWIRNSSSPRWKKRNKTKSKETKDLPKWKHRIPINNWERNLPNSIEERNSSYNKKWCFVCVCIHTNITLLQ
jgi:hypothetical protein